MNWLHLQLPVHKYIIEHHVISNLPNNRGDNSRPNDSPWKARFQARALAREATNLNISICRGIDERVRNFFKNCIGMLITSLNTWLFAWPGLWVCAFGNFDIFAFFGLWGWVHLLIAITPHRANSTMNSSLWGSSYCRPELGLLLAPRVLLFIIHTPTHLAKQNKRKKKKKPRTEPANPTQS